jgi:hypothetical protein
MRINDDNFDKLLTSALYRAAELDYGDMPSDEELEMTVQPSQRFRRKMKNLLRNPRRHIRSQRRPVYLKVLRSAAAVFIALTILFGAAMAASPTVRAAVVGFFRTWLEDRTIYEIPTRDLDSEWTFGYIPEGFELVEKLLMEFQQHVYIYQNSDSARIGIVISSGKQIVDNEHSDFYQITINGNPADVYETNDPLHPSIVVMYDKANGVFITFNAEIEISEIIKIAENIE